MKPDPKAEITEGEVYGSPVRGGWPDRGPFQVLGDAMGRVFGPWKSGDRAEARRRPEADSPEPTSADPAKQDSDK